MHRCIVLVLAVWSACFAVFARAQSFPVLPIGQSFKGTVDQVGDARAFLFEGVEGSKITIKVSGKDGLLPQVRVQDTETLEVLAFADGKKKAILKNFELPHTGSFFVRIAATGDAQTGAFTGKINGKLPKADASPSIAKSAGAGEAVVFAAAAGMVLSGDVTLQKGASSGLFFTLFGPRGLLDLTPVVQLKNGGTKAEIKSIVLPDLGVYVLAPLTSDLDIFADLSLGLAKTNGKFDLPAGATELVLAPPQIDDHPAAISQSSFQFSGTAPGAAQVFAHSPVGTTTVAVANGAFAVTVALLPNAVNTVYFTAAPPAGAAHPSAPAPTSIVVDAEPPVAAIQVPSDGLVTYADSITVAGTISDSLSGADGMFVSLGSIEGVVNLGIGTNGTFVIPEVPLSLGIPTNLTVTAADGLGNFTNTSVTVTRATPPNGPWLAVVSGDGQTGKVQSDLDQPLVVRLMKGTEPFANKLVTFRVIRSDGRLRASQGAKLEDIVLAAQTDAAGEARVFWRLGWDAGVAAQRVEVTSSGVSGKVVFCATGTAAKPTRLHLTSGDLQRAQIGGMPPLPLVARVTDGVNPIAGVPVTFKVIDGQGTVDGASNVAVASDAAGEAKVEWRLGPFIGVQRVRADFDGNQGQPITFTARGVATQPSAATGFAGIVFDNNQRPIGGARVELRVGSQTQPSVLTGPDGRFAIEDLPATGPAELTVDGSVATTVGGAGVPPNSFPSLHFQDVLVVKGLANALGAPVRLPRLLSANAKSYDGTADVELTCTGIDGLKLLIKAGSMTRADNTQPSPLDPEVVSLNQVHYDEIPMPLPDGRALSFAWTLQPAGARFSPPIHVEMPNMSGQSPGALTFIQTFDHATGRFEIVGTARVSDDGASIVSEPGSGLTLAGWGGSPPPPPPAGDGDNDPCKGKKEQGQQIAAEIAKLLNEADALYKQAKDIEDSISTWTILACTVGIGAGIVGLLLCLAAVPISTACVAAALVGLALTIGDCAFHADSFYQKVIKGTGLQAQAAAKYAQAIAKFGQLNAVCPGLIIEPWLQQKAAQLKPLLDALKVSLANLKAKLEALKQKISEAQSLIDQAQDFLDSVFGAAPGGTDEGMLKEMLDDLVAVLEEAKALSGAVDKETPNVDLETPQALLEQLASLTNFSSVSVAIGSRTGVVDPTGGFVVENVPAGPALVAPIFTIDDGSQILFGRGPFHVIEEGKATKFGGTVPLSPTPPATPVDLRFVDAGTMVLQVGDHASVTLEADMSDGSLDGDASSANDGTWYLSSNSSILESAGDGVVNAISTGTAYLTASNQGVTTVKRVDVVDQVVQTNVLGFVTLANGAPAEGAAVTSSFGGSAQCGPDGGFTLPVMLSSATNSITLTATLIVGGQELTAFGAVVEVIPGGDSDGGVLVLGLAGSINVAVGKPVTTSGGFSGVAPATLTDGLFRPKNTQWQNATVWWTGGSPSVTVDLQGTFVLVSVIVQADDNDSYVLEYLDADTDTWSTLWGVPNYDGFGSGMQTRPNPNNDSEQFVLPTPASAKQVRVRAGSGDNSYSLAEIQVFGVPLGGG